MSLFHRACCAALIGVCGAGLISGIAPAAPSASLPGEIVLPVMYGDSHPSVGALEGNDQAVVWSVRVLSDDSSHGQVIRYTLLGTGEQRTANVALNSVDLAGTNLVGINGTPYHDERVVRYDLRTGEQTVLAQYGLNEQATFLAALTNGWLRMNKGALERLTYGVAETATYPLPPHDGDWAQVWPIIADDHGVVVNVQPDDYALSATLDGFTAYLDFASGTWTVLERFPASTGNTGYAGLSATTLVWTQGKNLKWWDRSAGCGPVHTQALGVSPNRLAVNGTNIAFTHNVTDADGTKRRTVSSGPVGGPYTAVTSTSPAPGVALVAIDRGDFGMWAGTNVQDEGLYRLHPGGKKLGAVVATIGPSAPYGITAAAGRLVSITPAKNPDAESRTVTSTSSSVSAGAPSTLIDSITEGEVPDVSGGHSVHQLGENGAAVVQDGTKEIARFRVAGHGVGISGQRVISPIDAGHGSEIVDIATRQRQRVPYTQALFGTDIAYILPSGEVRRRNVVTGQETVVRPAGLPAGLPSLEVTSAIVQIHGDWVLYAFPQRQEQTWNPVGAVAEAVNTVTGRRVSLGAGDWKADKYNVRLVDGVLAWTEYDSRALHVLDLSTGTDRVIGTVLIPDVLKPWVALTNEFVAWVSQDERIHVLPLGSAADGASRYLGNVDRGAFSPGENAYRPQVDVSRPLKSWTMTIRAGGSTNSVTTDAVGSGAKIRTLTGSARTGAIRPTWDGRDANGKRVPDGTYVWTLTGSGAAGALRQANSTSKVITGTVRVDSRTPRPAFTLPAKANSSGFDVRWRSKEKGTRFTVIVEVGTSSGGAVRWSKPKKWLVDTAASHARYRNGKATPVDLVKGRSYRFTVTSTDVAGNAASVSRVVTVR